MKSLSVYSSALSACLFGAILQNYLQSRSIITFPFSLFFLSSLCIFVSFSLSAFPLPSANSHLFLLLSRTNKQRFRLRDEEWLSAQRLQLVSISRQGGKDDRERCWNESSVWAPSLFNLAINPLAVRRTLRGVYVKDQHCSKMCICVNACVYIYVHVSTSAF